MDTTPTCLNCGESVRPDDRFCARCGDELALGSHSTALLDREAYPDDEPESPWAEVVQRLRRATLGEFEIGRELGRGGMAAVFLAREISLDRRVAIKVMSPGLLMGDGMIDRFKREAITIAHLNHPNIVSCYSVRQAEGLHFFVMRYIRGRSLEQLIQEAGKLPLPIVRSIFCQVGSALTYAHRSRVVHRDVKPANILIDEEGNAVVTDFGIAKVAELPGHTHTGALVGTPAYMSPEQCSDGDVSGASDQYSLGAVTYEMVTGVAPFTGSTLTVMQAQVEQVPPSIRHHAPDCPPEIEDAILRMLAKDPAGRFSSIAEAKAALGATPLMEDDPLLGELCRLAAAGALEPATGGLTPARPTPFARGSSASVRGSQAPQAAPAGQARAITVLPPPAELAVGDGFALVALVRGERGVPLPGRIVEWTTDAPAVLHIDQARKVATAVAAGSAMLTASCEGVHSRVRIQVPAMALESLELEPDEPAATVQISAPPKSVRTGDSFVLTATPLDLAGRPLNQPNVLWNTSDVRIAVVTAEGWVAALGPGQVVLTATRGDASASVTIQVETAIARAMAARPPRRRAPPGNPVPLSRSGWRRRGSRFRRALFNGGVGVLTVGASVWLVGGLRDFRSNPGPPAVAGPDTRGLTADSTLRAESTGAIEPGDSEAATKPAVKPRPRRPASPEPSPASVSIAPHAPVRAGDTITLTAVVVDDSSQPLTGADVAWASREPALATVDSATGKVLAKASGTARIIAQSGQDTATLELTVLPAHPSLPDTSGYVPLGAEPSREETALETTAVPPASPPVGPRPDDRHPGGHSPRDSARDHRQLESSVRDGVSRCYDAVRSKNLERLASTYHPETAADEEKLKRLSRILRTVPWQAAVGKRVDGARELGSRTAAAEFSFRLTWRDALGGRLVSQPIFRAEFARSEEGWTLSSCRIVGSPKL